MTDPISVDGSRGEGGGQVLRTALALSAVTGRPARIDRIRAGRPQPGLRPQHLAAVKAAGIACGARAAGAAVGSTELLFVPAGLKASEIDIEIGTAGSVALVLQTVAVPLSVADGPSRVTLRGGTHVPWSPTMDFLFTDWGPAMQSFGLPVSLRSQQCGYYPAGGGDLLALIPGGGKVLPFVRRFRGNLQTIRGRAFTSCLSGDIAERIAREARRHLRRAGVAVRIDSEDRPAIGQGAGIHLEAILEDGTRAGFSALGDRTRSSEMVAREAVNDLFEWLDSGAAVSKHLADQILLPLALASEPSSFTVSPVTKHLVTNAEVIRRFLPVRIDIAGEVDGAGQVTITPAAG
ncbi:MAG: RNA 3'-terminal phosphate cyclase [Planctomycetes bacterium]|jgi:RNA 3'-terminal phosphate cyclase (ATP)|nr:RNA 3'-terminal phosphate cyclase [Planctomycetota bacterium]